MISVMNARWLLLFALTLVACAPAGLAMDGSTAFDSAASRDGAIDSSPDAALFDANGVDPRAAPALAVIVETCGATYCHHGSGATAASRDLSEQHVRETLALRSLQVPRLRLVEPGRPDDSYLVHKLLGTMSTLAECRADAMACGTRMPSPTQPLDAQQIAVVRQWIADGAPGL
jgi:hypothetical protein